MSGFRLANSPPMARDQPLRAIVYLAHTFATSKSKRRGRGIGAAPSCDSGSDSARLSRTLSIIRFLRLSFRTFRNQFPLCQVFEIMPRIYWQIEPAVLLPDAGDSRFRHVEHLGDNRTSGHFG